jgi:multicomponent Na+:H+ antiporter subunit G
VSTTDLVGSGCLLIGVAFFLAGSVGVIRFPDIYTRLHAVTKADNLGLGFVLLGVAVHAGNWVVAGKLLVTWLLVLLAGTTGCHLVARHARRSGVQPWRRP